jgi:Delta24(24(1))-sterol reductase
MGVARNRSRNSPTEKSAEVAVEKQVKIYTDGESDDFEFGGSLGVTALMISFPLLMWYMWIGATYYDGKLPMPAADQTWGDFGRHLAQLVYEGAYPTKKAWAIFWTFFLAEAVMYVVVHLRPPSLAAETNIL